MNQFSISQLAQFSGVKPHTIRIWEQRYNALQPKRSEGNTRYYDGGQLRRLLNIVSLSKTNYKVSQLCTMEDEELFELLEAHYQQAAEKHNYDYFVNLLIAAGINYDEPGFDKVFSHCLLRFGMEKAYVKVISPLLQKLGFMWSANVVPPSQEHFLCNLVRQKIFTAIDSLPPPNRNSETWLLFLPESELHEIGLLFASYFIRSKGKNTIFLGMNVPLSSIEDTLNSVEINKILLFLVHKDLPENIREYLQQLKQIGEGKEIFVASNEELNREKEVQSSLRWLRSVGDLEAVLTSVGELTNKS